VIAQREVMISEKDSHTDQELRKIYNFKKIAVIGMSKNPEKAGHFVPKYLINKGYTIIPVNPNSSEIMGMKSYARVSDVIEPVEIVDVFRKSEDILDVVRDVVQKEGVKLLWLQEGIHNPSAEELALSKGIDVIYNRCMMAEHMRLFGN